ncbi:hypothetical protein BU26DRAFT_513408 [Trematosphaeria pertusa]|uniref:Uncharacterized protein n=1 Tax=Trematosphaeria pertusa TaxID=390896 RepID=A0A6A6J540_9PLEO|nr:uncharacterized protein BU26DRAFT_513408 [Trematosphaeria pertusa]KAF2256603.1 hypothetical protein BU26DRAFT_513408 [Trematosphaeria pertusa]
MLPKPEHCSATLCIDWVVRHAAAAHLPPSERPPVSSSIGSRYPNRFEPRSSPTEACIRIAFSSVNRTSWVEDEVDCGACRM